MKVNKIDCESAEATLKQIIVDSITCGDCKKLGIFDECQKRKNCTGIVAEFVEKITGWKNDNGKN